MNVYVESNFILELALLREEHEECEALLTLATSGAICLVIPAFCVGEPFEVLLRRTRRRKELDTRLETEVAELARSKPYRESFLEFQRVRTLLIESVEGERQRVASTLDRVLQAAEVIPIARSTLGAALRLQEERSLSPQDSIVLASILSHMREIPSGPHCFITRDARDFANPYVRGDLAAFNGRLFTRFRDGLGYSQSRL